VAETSPSTFTATELTQIDRANASGKQPVVFVHGLWLLASSWDRWASFFEDNGYIAVTPGWPDDPASVGEARENPDRFAGKGVGQVADYHQAVIERLERKPALVGHSFGGLLVQILAGRGLAAATVAISPAPSRGVLPLPISALKAALPVLRNPANTSKAITLSFEQFRFGFANALSEDEARALYEQHHVAGSGLPIFQAALANANPRTEVRVDTTNPARGPLLIVSGKRDHQVPWSLAKGAYHRQRKNEAAVTEVVEIPERGHSLTIDRGWQDVAQTALDFIRRFVA